MGDDSSSSTGPFTAVSSNRQATSQLNEIVSGSQVAVVPNVASSPLILGPNNVLSNTSVSSVNVIPASSTVTFSTINNLGSNANTISYHPSLSFHPTIGNSTIAYQTLVPHPNFVSHPNVSPYPNMSCQSSVTSQPRPNSLPPPPALSVLPPHTTLVPFNSQTIINAAPDPTVSVAQTSVLQNIYPHEQLNGHHSGDSQSQMSHPQDNSSMKHSKMETTEASPSSWTSDVLMQTTPKTKTQNNQMKNSISNPPMEGSSECFVCSSIVTEAVVSLSSVMPYSHAPLLVLLADVLGYVLNSPHTLHSKVVCDSCYRLLEVIDEVQNTQTKNKADVRRQFQLTVANKHLTYARSHQASGRWLCRRCGVVSLTRGGARKRTALTTHRGRKRSLRWPGSGGGKGRISRTKELSLQDKEVLHDAKDANNVQRTAETVTVEPDIHVEDLTKLKCGTNTSAPNTEQSSPPITKTVPVHENGITPSSSANTPTAPPPTAVPPSGSSALLPIFDDDPIIFNAGERIKVGVMRRACLSRQSRYQCHYCSHACESGMSLKMHVRVVHRPLLLYDAVDTENTSEDAPSTNESEEELLERKFCLRMGVELRNVVTDPLSVKPFVCLFCEWAYKLQSSLQSHYRDQHSPRKPYQCPRCPENFRRNIDLTRHRLYRCPERAKGTKRLKKQ